MAKSIKLTNDTYWDSSNIIHNNEPLSDFLEGSIILYNNESGESSTVNLSNSVENYKYIEIFFKNKENSYSSLKVYNANNKIACLISYTQNNTGNYKGIYFRLKTVRINAKTITPIYGSQFWVSGDNSCGLNLEGDHLIKITMVIGYKN